MKKQTGFTLIEIMLALLIGLIVVAATISIYISTIRGSSDIVKSARLNHDLDSALALMVNDIRRAGYWAGAMVGSDSRDNPFTKPGTTDLQIPSASCVLYTYDADASGTVNDIEYYGFKLEGANIRMRIKGDTTVADGCLNSDKNIWKTLNVSEGSEQIDVTNLTFTESFKCLRKRLGVADQSYDTTCAAAVTAGSIVADDRVIETREISIALAGRVNGDHAVTKNLAGRVKIRNDRIFTQ
jgi:prepilin peptidase dependent protein B